MTVKGRPTSSERALPGLAPHSTTKERIAALLELGLPPAELRKAIGVSDATIRNWNEQATVPREGALRALDDLRTAFVALDQAGISGSRAVQWLTSRNLGRWLRGARPIDVLRSDPLLTLAAIQDLLAPAATGAPASVVHLQVVADASSTPTAGHTMSSARKRARRRPAATR